MEYPKTENLYASNGAQDATRRSGPEFGFRQEAVGQIATWLVTEKVDGMNMRVVWEPYPSVECDVNEYQDTRSVQIYGRTDRANIPGDLMQLMRETFTFEKLAAAFNTNEDFENSQGSGVVLPERVVLFGEGFGPGIQGGAGAAYGGSKRFALFDVVVNNTWLRWDDVCDVAAKLDVPTVPLLVRNVDLETAKLFVRETRLQPADSEHVEGVVVRTDPYLFDGRGRRVMFKYKVRDL